MRLQHLTLSIALLSFACISAQAQNEDALTKNKNYKGATATLAQYKVIYQLDTSDPKVVEKALHGIENVLADPRLKGKLEIELVTFSSGTEIQKKNSVWTDQLKHLVTQGVIVAQCANSLVMRKLTTEDIHDFVAVVPSANGELVIRHGEGWAIVKP